MPAAIAGALGAAAGDGVQVRRAAFEHSPRAPAGGYGGAAEEEDEAM